MVINDIYRQMCGIMQQNQNSDVRFEADCLIEFVLGKKRIELAGCEISQQDSEKLISFAKKRQGGYPLQYILGRWYFFDMELFVGEGVLIPRQDTETVCEAAFEVINQIAEPAVIDLCSGSGCIALAVKKYCPKASVVAVEKSNEAYKYLKDNIEKTGLQVLPVLADVLRFDDKIEQDSFDVIISNPPYIDNSFKGKLQKELEYEPDMALFAENNGLYFYRFIAHYYKKAIKEGGYLIFEYGYDQQSAVKNILIEEGYSIVKEIIDLAENPRGVIAKR